MAPDVTGVPDAEGGGEGEDGEEPESPTPPPVGGRGP